MSKFFVKDDQITGKYISIIDDDVNHIKNVLRLKIEDEIKICSIDTSKNYLCKIKTIDKKNIECEIIEEFESVSESDIEIDIYQGLPKADKMELIIQKGTELGVHSFCPVIFKRSIVKLDDKDKLKKQIRWQKISEVAAKQSGRDIVPKILEVKKIKDICTDFDKYDIVIVAYENEENNTLKAELKKIDKEKLKIAVVIGPEGGIDETEIQEMRVAGAKIVSLGKRILRTETVALVMAAIINYELENTEDK